MDISSSHGQLNIADRQPWPVRVLAHIVSVVFHPLFIPTYVFYWVWTRFPYEFASIDSHMLRMRLIGVFWTTAFFPAFVVFLLSRLKAIASIRLRQRKDRIIPYITTMFFYWWMWYLSRNFTDQALALKFFYFGIFLATVPALILNNFFKISMHAMGVGGMLAAIVLCCNMYHTYLGADIAIAVLVSGLVLTSRLALAEHDNKEIYTGFVVGALTQGIAYWAMV